MSGGFCSNCHEEVFIAEQYSDLGWEVPGTILRAASEHMNDPNRMQQAEKNRQNEAAARKKASDEFWGL